MTEIRSRHRYVPTASFNHPSSSASTYVDDDVIKLKQPGQQYIGLHQWILFILTNFCLILFIQHANYVVPIPLTTNTAPPDRFVEELARVHLDALVSLGPRPTGSYENEVLAVEYLVQAIEAVQHLARAVHKVELDVQRVSGSFSLISGRVMSVYQNVNNVIVKLSPNIPGTDLKTSDSVLINCHYDSVINGSGASDDAVSCSTMLEVLRVIALGHKPLRNSIIFLFNGAEEIGLQASHGFITKHKWARDVKAFINLEAAGAGGKELLFQSGPDYPWLMHTYVEHAPHPFASIIVQEVFSTGIIPSDTDFRIFRDFGHIPGLDIGYITNGYVYHTPSDLPHMILPGCIQHAGDNLLAVVRAIADSPYLTDPGQYRHGKLIYFDFFGYFMIAYTVRVGWIINLVCLGAVAFWISRRVRNRCDSKISFTGGRYLSHLALGVIAIITSWLMSVGSALLVALSLDYIGCPMTWFTRVPLVTGLFAAPVLAVSLAWFTVILGKFASRDRAVDLRRTESVYFDAVLVIFSVALAVLTWLENGASYIFVSLISMPLVARACTENCTSNAVRLLTHCVGVLIPNLLVLYTLCGALLMFVPITGRSDAKLIPDVFISALVAGGLVIVLAYYLGFVFVSRFVVVKRVILGAVIVFVITLILVLITPLGFPYKSDESGPTRQRHQIYHMQRTIRDTAGMITETDSSILDFPHDRNGMLLVGKAVPVLANLPVVECRKDLPYCGIPHYLPEVQIFDSGISYKLAKKHDFTPRAHLEVLNRTLTAEGNIRIYLSVSGPCHINVYFTLQPGVKFVSMSEGDGRLLPTKMPSDVNQSNYFISYAYGSVPITPWVFSLDLSVKKGDPRLNLVNGGLLSMALGAHYLTIDSKGTILTTELNEYIRSMPDWTVPIGWAVTYDSWML